MYHTYSTYARGLEDLIGTFLILDRAPKGAMSPAPWNGCAVTMNTGMPRRRTPAMRAEGGAIKDVVPEAGVEPARAGEGAADFKSAVSTNFTTRARRPVWT